MADLSAQLEGLLGNLRAALQENNSREIDRSEREVRDILITSGDYRFIGDERLLAQADTLLSEALGDTADNDLTNLRLHLSLLRDIHDKFYAALSADEDLDTLLLHHLSTWNALAEPISCSFSDDLKNELHKARTTGDTEQRLKGFYDIFLRGLREQALSDVADQIEPLIRQSIEGYRRLRQWPVFALFALGEQGDVYGVKMTSLPNGTSQVRAMNSIGEDMLTAARKAVEYVVTKRPAIRNWDFRLEISRGDIQFDGGSIGLGLTLAALTTVENLEIDAYTAFTGQVTADGLVKRIEHLSAKLEAARKLGVRRVFIPQENMDDCSIEGLKIVPVTSIEDTLNKLRSTTFRRESTDLKSLAENKIREIEIVLEGDGIRRVSQHDQTDSCIRVEFTNGRDTVLLMVYHSKQIKPIVQGKPSTLQQQVQNASNTIFGQKLAVSSATPPGKPEIRRYVNKLGSDQQKLLHHILNRGDGVRESEKDCIYRLKISKAAQTVYVRQYTNGTLTVAGLSPLLDEIDADVRAVIGIGASTSQEDYENGKKKLQAQVDAVNAVDLGEMWIGTDEAGKGDYYGPLVAAAILVDQQLASELQSIGVKDSKTSSDRRNLELAEAISRVCGKRAKVVTIPPERYNTLYEEFQREGKSLNTLLAWGHTRALEDILTEYPQQQITVIVDKFGDEHFVRNKLLSKSRDSKLNLVQLPKAEANIAVAAASVLARAQFLSSLTRMSENYRIDFPKGSSDPRVVQIGKQILSRYGESELRKVAKLHFATTQKVRGNN